MDEPQHAIRLPKAENATTSFVPGRHDPVLIARIICGLLNSVEGGTVYVGVDEKGRAARAYKAQDAESLAAALQTEISPAALYSVSVDALDGGDVLTIDIPPGSDRPYVVGGEIWVRDKTMTRTAGPNDIRAMFVGAEQAALRWERRISTGLSESDLDLALVRRVRERAESAGRLALEDAGTEVAMLHELAFSRPKGFTQACDVVFAAKPSQRLPQTRVQLVEFSEDKTDDTYGDYRWFEGSAIDNVEQIYAALQAHNKTRAQFHQGSLERDERPAYHDFPLREGIVNALAHRSYESYSGGAKVTVYPDRIEFWNTGQLPPEIKVRDLPRKHQSYPVNPDIAHAFFMNRFMDRTGRGAERIAEACKQIGAPKPVWTEDRGGVTLTLYAARSPEMARASLNDRQRAFLDTVLPGEALALDAYAERFADGVSSRQARRDLIELEALRFVRKEGRSVATLYRRLKN